MADDHDLTPPLLPHGRRDAPRDPNTGRFAKGSAATTRPPIGRGRLYAIKRLSRDGRYDLVAMVRNRQISAHAALDRLRSEPSKPVVDPETFAKMLVG
jgi:hypothetical protein